MKVKKVKVIRGDILVDISKEKLGKLIDIVVKKGLESLDETLEELDILLFLDCTGKHGSRYLELKRLSK
jgi:hypothetical protein